MDGISIRCKHCHEVFYICKSCYRGHKYCSATFKRFGYRNSANKAQQKYQQTFRRKLNHAKRQYKYRHKIKKVTHKTSIEFKPVLKKIEINKKSCLVCRKSISRIFIGFEKLKYFRRFYEKT